MRRIDDDIGITRSVFLKTLAEVVSHPGETLRRVRQTAPAQSRKCRKIGEAAELEERVARPGHRNSSLCRPLR